MTTYHITNHALERLQERFPNLSRMHGCRRDLARWLERLCARAKPCAQQSGMDLMLRVDLTTVEGPTPIYLPVTPVPGDGWVVRTVLTGEQGANNIHEAEVRHRQAADAAWRARKGFNRPSARRTAHLLPLAADTHARAA